MSQYNNIKITPNIGVTSDPIIEFTGAANSTITLKVLDTTDGGITFEGQKAELLSLVDADVSFGSSVASFSVNDFYGFPQIQAYNDGRVLVAPYGAQTVGIGTTNPQAKLDVTGDAYVSGSFGIGTTNIFSGGNTNSLTLDGKIVVGNAIGSTNLSNVLSPNAETGVNAYRSYNLIDTSSAVKIVRVSSFTAGAAIELQHWNENIDTQYGYWDLVTERGHFAFRDKINAENEKNRIFISNNGNVLIGSTSGNIGISSDESVGFGTDNILQINGNVYLGGNVGIGTSLPSSKMDVRGDLRVGINTSQGLVLTSPNGTTFRLVVDDSGNLTAISTTL